MLFIIIIIIIIIIVVVVVVVVCPSTARLVRAYLVGRHVQPPQLAVVTVASPARC